MKNTEPFKLELTQELIDFIKNWRPPPSSDGSNKFLGMILLKTLEKK